jgi:hypothetical protein
LSFFGGFELSWNGMLSEPANLSRLFGKNPK